MEIALMVLLVVAVILFILVVRMLVLDMTHNDN
ncbi:hypothetical protein SAMN04488494_3067 [Xylanibacter ruminicola]|jgi:hypothetical protein|uniref:Uncharacterized protein n=1 Tax=Xylanibacter ruminicola TaxID=839 RepID=A0A1M7N3X0_XYLRU|nr:hypothetical protein SAMN04488493_10178 [Xylanibacter ruminicola]SHM98224.1 hypothetical protein SAMN04488494_3067 [Xylanibacter ruminicola]